LLRPAQIVVGKLIASSAYLMVVIACALPVIAIPYLLGGVPVRTVITCLIVLAAIAIELAAVSVWVSSWFTKPVGAIVTALAMSLALCLGPWIVAGLTLVSQVTVAAAESPPPFDENAARLLAATSPTALFGFVDLGDIADDDPAGSSGRLVAAACWLGVTTLCIRGASKRVVAPAERDR
jgi:ABC-2 type transport system permease protein